MKRFIALLAGTLLAVAATVGVASAQQLPEHPHVMLLDFELVDVGDPSDPSDDVVDFRACIDLAGNQALGLQAHHSSLHTGTAGFGNPSVGITRAGHVVVPLEPFPGGLPFEDCDALAEAGFPNA